MIACDFISGGTEGTPIALSIDEAIEVLAERFATYDWTYRPEDAGVIIEVVQKLGKDIPILGVCLGHQAICAAFGAQITYAKQLMHGKQSRVKLDPHCLLFRNCPEKVLVARYHSLAADPDTMPEELVPVALTEDGEIMAVMHKTCPVWGVQFHPESIMTPEGSIMLENFLRDIR